MASKGEILLWAVVLFVLFRVMLAGVVKTTVSSDSRVALADSSQGFR